MSFNAKKFADIDMDSIKVGDIIWVDYIAMGESEQGHRDFLREMHDTWRSSTPKKVLEIARRHPNAIHMRFDSGGGYWYNRSYGHFEHMYLVIE